MFFIIVFVVNCFENLFYSTLEPLPYNSCSVITISYTFIDCILSFMTLPILLYPPSTPFIKSNYSVFIVYTHSLLQFTYYIYFIIINSNLLIIIIIYQ